MSGFVTGVPRSLLRIEGFSVLAAAAVGYAGLGRGWWLFALLFFSPDLSMAGYLLGRKAGAVTYNILHNYAGPLALLLVGSFWPTSPMLAIALIWAAHIGFDRALGYGLKYADGFGFTHLGPIGAAHTSANARSDG